ncbi:hypothetical protein [Streptomyces sp. PA5.6]|uniref:hypothetical protein n=1 Tax=Streptomyces sp. PA5.6 TaxID=3035651 RepID=UPI003904804C
MIRTAACVVSEGRRVLHFWHPHSCRWSIKQDAVASGEQCMLHAAYRGLMRTAAVEGLTHDPVHTLPLLIEASRAAVQHSYTYYYLFRTLQEAACCSVMNSAEVAWLPLRDVGNERLRHRLWEATAPLQAADEGAPW